MKNLKRTDLMHESRGFNLNSANDQSITEMTANILAPSCGRGKKMERAMTCPNLDKLDMQTCRAGYKSYTPSLFQFEGYCKSRFHPRCPFYLGYHL